MTTLSLEEVQAQLPQLLESLPAGDEITISSAGLPVAQIKKLPGTRPRGKAGCYKKEGFWMSPDFDAPLDEFKEYME